jgi:alkanesulfonate monooxygenase SsuD/methylene tetrahydromethanopterin reductase-like flavin-dependent oxidoreductase (luciferase family)
MSYVVTPERFRRSLEKIQAFADAAGRRVEPGRGFEPAHLTFTVVDDDRERARAAAARYLSRQYNQPFDELVTRYCVLGPPERCAEDLARFAAAGVRTFVIGFVAGPERAEEQVERFAAEVLPRVRQA